MSGGDPMKPANPGVKLTCVDYVPFPDDGLRHELILPLSTIFED